MTKSFISRNLRGVALAALATTVLTTLAVAQDVGDVPRNETLVLTPWGDQPAQLGVSPRDVVAA